MSDETSTNDGASSPTTTVAEWLELEGFSLDPLRPIDVSPMGMARARAAAQQLEAAMHWFRDEFERDQLAVSEERSTDR